MSFFYFQILKILQMVVKNVTLFTLPITFIVCINIYIYEQTVSYVPYPSSILSWSLKV